MAQAKINKFIVTTALCSTLWAVAGEAKNIEYNSAHMQAMDKITGKVSEIDVPLNSEVKFGSFSIVVRSCSGTPPEETPENYAFVDVVDTYDAQKPVSVFRGWMMSSSPALNAIEHPIYDVWLLKCQNSKTPAASTLSSEELKQREEIPMAPKDEQTAETDVKPLEAPVAAEDTTAVSAAENETVPTEAKADETPQQEPAAAVAVTPHADEQPLPAEDGAPKALISFEEPVSEAAQDNQVQPETAEKASESAAEAAPTVADEKPIEVNAVAEELLISEPELPAADVSNPSPALPENETEDTSPLPLANDDAAVEVPADDENQLIKFDEEIEEDGFDINADALVN